MIYINLDLKHLFNHQLFLVNHSKQYSSPTPTLNGGIASSAFPTLRFFSTSSFHLSSEKIEINHIPYIFPEILLNTYDNVLCEEQTCHDINEKCSEIHFLGLA